MRGFIIDKKSPLINVLIISLLFFPALTEGTLTHEEEINISVYKKTSPSVVNITTTTLIRDFFSIYPQEGAGSGTIISSEGYVLTNYHVVEDATEIHVTMSNGTKYPAQIVGSDPENDLAIIQITSTEKRGFKAVNLGDSGSLDVGQKVYAIGNPFGLNSTLTTGIISATGRPLTTSDGRVIENVIQTDAPINPGNSGGPLINTEGEMIGINTAIFTPSGGSVGIGFAIPIDSAKALIPDLIKYGKVRRPWVGIIGVPLWKELAVALDLPVSKGILVSEVIKGSPGDKSGIKGGSKPVQISDTIIYLGGDIILEVDGITVSSMDDIKGALKNKTHGQKIKVKVLRGKTVMLFHLKLELKT